MGKKAKKGRCELFGKKAAGYAIASDKKWLEKKAVLLAYFPQGQIVNVCVSSGVATGKNVNS